MAPLILHPCVTFMLSHWMPPLVVAFIGNVRMLLNVVRYSSHGPF